MSIGKEWAKFTQRTREGFGGEKTEIPEEITERKTKVEKIKKSMENFVSKTEVVVQPDPTKRVAGVFGAKDSAAKNPLFIFGQALMTTSNEYEGELSTLMRTFGESFTQIGELNNDLNHGIKEHFILPKVNFVKEDIKGALDEYDRLNSRRLEFDATKHKLKSAKEDKKPAIEQEISRTQAKFEESMSLAKAKLDHATDEEELQQSQKAQLMQMMYDLLEFHRKSYELLASLDSQYHFLQNSNHTAKEKPDFNAIAVSDKLAAASISSGSSSPGAPSTPARGSIPPPVASKKRAKALYDFPMSQEGDLPLQAGDIVDLTDTNHPDWWSGSCNGRTGMFPRNYVELI